MPRVFEYKPRFKDIRVRPPSAEEDKRAEDVNALKPGERACDHPGCGKAAATRAPKSRNMLNEHYWFCTPHAAEYNRSWNFFAGMSEGEVRARQQEELFTGGRPTWDMKATRHSREAAAAAGKAGTAKGYKDPFNIFGHGGPQARTAHPEDDGHNLGKIERAALADMDLRPGVDGAAIRARYAELVRRTHPDANGGDRSGEHKLQRVIKAYKTLRKAGMV